MYINYLNLILNHLIGVVLDQLTKLFITFEANEK
jgi:hypothetical protein